MVEFINATQARGEIEKILRKAKYDIVMISPYFKINDALVARLNDIGLQKKVNILVVCRKKDLNPGEREKLEKTPNLSLNFNERVHAKCFYNEDTMVITSLNLYDSSLGDNLEMGVLLRRDIESDKVAFEDAKREAQYIIRACQHDASSQKSKSNDTSQTPKVKEEAKPNDEVKPAKEPTIEDSIVKGISKFFGFSGNKDDEGHCIHCGNNIPFNIDAPYCPECYRRWAKFKDDNFKEKICGKCGKQAKTSKKHPVCLPCYKKLKIT